MFALYIFYNPMKSKDKLSVATKDRDGHALRVGMEKLRDRYGPWALVTGSASGLGRALSFELANTGLNLLLIVLIPTTSERISSWLLTRVIGRRRALSLIGETMRKLYPNLSEND